MSNIYESLLRIEKLYNCKSTIETAALLKMPNVTFYDNRRKAENEFKRTGELLNEINPIKKELLKKVIERKTTNSLYQAFVDLAARDNLNLNWVFYGKPPIYNNTSKIAKIVGTGDLKDYINDDTVAIPYYSNIKASAGNGYCNSENEELDYIVLPKNMIKAKKINALKVDGDSMSPNIKAESIILIDLEAKALKNNAVYVVRYDDEVYVKRIEELEDYILLRSDNIAYRTITAKKEDICIIGQVINTILNENIE